MFLTHRFSGLCLIAATLFLGLPSVSRADYAACKALHQAVPQKISGFKFDSRDVFDDKALGFGVSYDGRSKPSRLSYFHYDLGRDRPSQMSFDAWVKREIDDILKHHGQRNIKLGTPAKIKPGMLKDAVAFRIPFGEVYTYSIFAVVNECLVKIRYTGPKLSNNALKKIHAKGIGK